MREDLLHFLWRYQKFDEAPLQTTTAEMVYVLDKGQPNSGSGPDFLMAQIQIGSIRFAGAVELHLSASHWYQHGYHKDPAYDNVILHVVWEDDLSIRLPSGQCIPTLELRHSTDKELLATYQKNFIKTHQNPPCSPFVKSLPTPLWKHWRERLYLERLEERIQAIDIRLEELNNDWEALLFERMARGFGLNRNGESFEKWLKVFRFRFCENKRELLLNSKPYSTGNSICCPKPLRIPTPALWWIIMRISNTNTNWNPLWESNPLLAAYDLPIFLQYVWLSWHNCIIKHPPYLRGP